MVVRTEDYVASKLIVDDRVNEFNKNNPEFKAEWRYEESDFAAYFELTMYYQYNTAIKARALYSVDEIIKLCDPKWCIDWALKDLKVKIMKHVGKE